MYSVGLISCSQHSISRIHLCNDSLVLFYCKILFCGFCYRNIPLFIHSTIGECWIASIYLIVMLLNILSDVFEWMYVCTYLRCVLRRILGSYSMYPRALLWWACVCVCAQSLSRLQLFATPWTVAHQAPLSMGFSRQEYWSGCRFLLQRIFPASGSNPHLLDQQANSL